MVDRSVQVKPSLSDAVSYIESVKEAFCGEPEKYDEFQKILNDANANRVDFDIGIRKITELFEPHRRLLPGLSFFFPHAKRSILTKAKTIIIPPPKAARTNFPGADQHRCSNSDDTKRKRVLELDWEIFMKKLKTRFRSVDTHVVKSFVEIMNMYEEGKMKEEKVQEKVVNLIYYHEDLIEEFSKYFGEEEDS